MKHTPAPWRLKPLEGKYYGTKVEMSDGNTVSVWGSREWKVSPREEYYEDIMCDGHYEDIGDYANACLIAAAPEMYAFIEEITNAVGKYPELNKSQVVQDAYKVLAKAEGRVS